MTALVTRRAPMSDADQRKKGVEAEREPNFLFAPVERRFLPWAAGRLPRWILPDDMTALGVCAAYQLSNDGKGWLWVASGSGSCSGWGTAWTARSPGCAVPSGRSTAITWTTWS